MTEYYSPRYLNERVESFPSAIEDFDLQEALEFFLLDTPQFHVIDAVSGTVTPEMYDPETVDVSSNVELAQEIEALLTKEKRGYVILNLWETESNYCKDLLQISAIKMELSRRGIVSETANQLIFAVVDELQELHERFIGVLDDLVHPLNWSFSSSMLGQVFLDFQTELTKLYKKFIESYAISRKQLKLEAKNNVEFQLFLKEKYKQVGREVGEFLVLPVQRTTRYHLLLKDLVKETDPGHPDYPNLVNAWDAMKALADVINDQKRKADESMGLFEAYESTKNCPPTLVNSKRRMIYRCDVLDIATSKKCHIFVCSDLLMITLYLEGFFKKKEKRFRFLRWLDYRDVCVTDMEGDEASVLVTFQQRTNKDSLSTADIPEGTEWIYRFEGFEAKKNKKQFLMMISSEMKRSLPIGKNEPIKQ